MKRTALVALAAAGLVAGAASSAMAADVSTEPTSDYALTSAIICSGDANHLVDSVTSGPLSQIQAANILLTSSTGLNSETSDYLKATKPAVVYVVGGVDAIPETEVTAITAVDPGAKVYRVAGTNRFNTAHQLATLVDSMTAYFQSQSNSSSLGAARKG